MVRRLLRHRRLHACLCPALVVLALSVCALPIGAQQSEGRLAFEAFDTWRTLPAHASLSWDDTLRRYREHLLALGLSPDRADRTLRLALAHDEGVLYDRAYAGPPKFRTEPNRLLVDATNGVTPGKALDVGMGQGRNALFLARQGWQVTGFDVSAVGLAKARSAAAAQGLSIRGVLASDEEFAFGSNEWDLIAILYAIEKRSVFRVRTALRPDGLVVVEAAHRDASGAEWEFRSNELLEIFEGFTILKYEETVGDYDWAPGKPIRMVRLVARKPR
ncbi:MAG TPA: methyltransferase domain-containing protein [Luteitalea sp.]|nr:methyltransferase domain-containing protein [Luteitalea sp.]